MATKKKPTPKKQTKPTATRTPKTVSMANPNRR
jgi:hypothetical protein